MSEIEYVHSSNISKASKNESLAAYWTSSIDIQFPVITTDLQDGPATLKVGAPHDGYSIRTYIANKRMNGKSIILNVYQIRIAEVNFVDDDDRLQMQGEGFFQDELGLGHRAFLGVYNQEYAIGHIESALNFTRKIGVAGSVNDVDFVAVVENGGLLGGDGDAALVFLVHGVHNQSLGHLGLVGAESVRLLQETINEGGLAVVNVGDNSDVADFGSSGFHNLSIVALFGGFSKRWVRSRAVAPRCLAS